MKLEDLLHRALLESCHKLMSTADSVDDCARGRGGYYFGETISGGTRVELDSSIESPPDKTIDIAETIHAQFMGRWDNELLAELFIRSNNQNSFFENVLGTFINPIVLFDNKGEFSFLQYGHDRSFLIKDRKPTVGGYEFEVTYPVLRWDPDTGTSDNIGEMILVCKLTVDNDCVYMDSCSYKFESTDVVASNICGADREITKEWFRSQFDSKDNGVYLGCFDISDAVLSKKVLYSCQGYLTNREKKELRELQRTVLRLNDLNDKSEDLQLEIDKLRALPIHKINVQRSVRVGFREWKLYAKNIVAYKDAANDLSGRYLRDQAVYEASDVTGGTSSLAGKISPERTAKVELPKNNKQTEVEAYLRKNKVLRVVDNLRNKNPRSSADTAVDIIDNALTIAELNPSNKKIIKYLLNEKHLDGRFNERHLVRLGEIAENSAFLKGRIYANYSLRLRIMSATTFTRFQSKVTNGDIAPLDIPAKLLEATVDEVFAAARASKTAKVDTSTYAGLPKKIVRADSYSSLTGNNPHARLNANEVIADAEHKTKQRIQRIREAWSTVTSKIRSVVSHPNLPGFFEVKPSLHVGSDSPKGRSQEPVVATPAA